MLAAGAWLDIPAPLTTPAGIVHGASYTDVAGALPRGTLLLGAALAGCRAGGVQTVSRRLPPFVAASALYLLVSLGGAAYAAPIQRFLVAPNEQDKETPFILHNIAATRAAFALDNVEERELIGRRGAHARRHPTQRRHAQNVRLWDHQPLLDTFGQLQEIRPYYDFVSVDNDRYTINGEYRQIMLSARELNSTACRTATGSTSASRSHTAMA